MFHKLPLFIRLLRGQLKTLLAFVLLFSLGMSLFLTVDTMSIEFEDSLRAQSQMFIGGDIEIRLRRDFKADENKALNNLFELNNKDESTRDSDNSENAWRHSKESRFFTMLSNSSKTLLVQARAVDQNFPLVGEFADSTGTQIYPAPKPGEVYLPETLLKLMNLKLGDSIQVGTMQLFIKHILAKSPDSGFAFAQFTQRFYMNLSDIKRGNLDSKGSRIFRHHHYLSSKSLNENSVKDYKKSLLKALVDPEIRIESIADSDTELASRFSMAIRLAKLLSLFTFLMAALGALQFFFNHLDRERINRVLFQSLGMNENKIVSLYFWQGFVLTIFSVLVSVVFAKFWSWQLSKILSDQFDITIQGNIRFDALLLMCVASVGTYVLLMLGPLFQLKFETAQSTLQNKLLSWKLTSVIFVAQMVFGYGLSWWVTRSWMLSFIFLVVLVVGFVGMSLLVIFLDRLLQWFKKIGLNWSAWNSLRLLIIHRPGKSILVYCLIGLVTLVLYLMPGLNSMLRQQLLPEDKQSLPKWFMIDIQDHHLDSIAGFLKTQDYEETQFSPMIRARLLKINGENFVRQAKGETLEDEQERRMRNRGYNLSYKTSLDSSETLIEGLFWNKAWNGEGVPEVSVESRFMKRLGFEMGDTLLFEVEGFPVAGKITSVRKIRWSSFKPNFFVQFQPGVLEMAPKTYILSLPLLPAQNTIQFQRDFFNAFPTISLIDLEDVVQITITQLEKISIILTGITFFALLCGMVLLLEVAHELAKSAKKEMHIRLSLGQSAPKILKAWLVPIYAWIISAWTVGYLLHIIFVTLIGRQIFGDLPWTPELKEILWSLPVAFGFLTAIFFFFYRALYKEKTLEILRTKN